MPGAGAPYTNPARAAAVDPRSLHSAPQGHVKKKTTNGSKKVMQLGSLKSIFAGSDNPKIFGDG